MDRRLGGGRTLPGRAQGLHELRAEPAPVRHRGYLRAPVRALAAPHAHHARDARLYLEPGALLAPPAGLPVHEPPGRGRCLLRLGADARGPVGGMRVERTARRAPAVSGAPAGAGALDLIFRHRYLAAVATVALLTNWVNTNGENLLFRVLQETLREDVAARGLTGTVAVRAFVRDGTTAFYGNYFFWVNLCALLAQALLASRLLRWGGIGAVLLLLPIISLISYSSMAVLPVLGVVRVTKIAENATNYSIDNTARQVIWLPTTTEMKYWTKPAIDSLFLRLGDGMAALTILVGLQLLHLPTRHLALVNVALVGCWLGAAVVIVLEYRRLMRAGTPAAIA
ncbi:MAG: hypothetical protein E6J81_14125 [Deltaproteobacteria bacterium]|nr:MAG: hypothetical protein E6J81_14125 [Deltaproteobacteria bacterium]